MKTSACSTALFSWTAALATLLAASEAHADSFKMATISGTVTDPRGVPLVGAEVHVQYPNNPEGRIPQYNPVKVGSSSLYQLTLTNVPTGGAPYSAYGLLPGYEMAFEPTFFLQPEQNLSGINIKMVSDNPAVSVSGLVVDLYGVPVPNAPVHIRYADRADPPDTIVAYTDADGYYTVTVNDVPVTGEDYVVEIYDYGCDGVSRALDLQRGYDESGIEIVRDCGLLDPFDGPDWSPWVPGGAQSPSIHWDRTGTAVKAFTTTGSNTLSYMLLPSLGTRVDFTVETDILGTEPYCNDWFSRRSGILFGYRTTSNGTAAAWSLDLHGACSTPTSPDKTWMELSCIGSASECVPKQSEQPVTDYWTEDGQPEQYHRLKLVVSKVTSTEECTPATPCSRIQGFWSDESTPRIDTYTAPGVVVEEGQLGIVREGRNKGSTKWDMFWVHN